MKEASGHSSTDEVITRVLGKKRNCTSRENYFLLTKEITAAEHCFTILRISTKTDLHIFFQSLTKERKVGVEGIIVSFYFKVNST